MCRGDDQVDVLEPRQVVLGRARRAVHPLRDLGQRQRLVLGQDLEDRLERAVAAGALQPQLVAIPAPGRQAAVGGQQRRQGAHRVAAALAHRRRGLAQRPHVGGAAVGQRLHARGQVVAIAAGRRRRSAAAWPRRRTPTAAAGA